MPQVLRCKDCKKEFPLTEEDRNVALIDLIEQGKIERGHIWTSLLEEEETGCQLRHETEEDMMEEQADNEVCPTCGVPHGSNPYMGCGLP